MYVSKNEIEKAKQMDLLTYLANYEPTNLVKEANNSYCTKEHDSLKISNTMILKSQKKLQIGKIFLLYMLSKQQLILTVRKL